MISYNKDNIESAIQKLPSEEIIVNKCNNMNITLYKQNSINSDIQLDENISIDDFIELAKLNNSSIFYNIKYYPYDLCLITAEDIEDNIIIDFIDMLTDDNSDTLAYLVDLYNEELYENKHINKHDTEEELDINCHQISEFIDISDELEDEDEDDEYENEYSINDLNFNGKNIYKKITNFNDNVNMNYDQYTEKIILSCIINNKIISLEKSNKLPINSKVFLAELLHEYQIEYNNNKKQFKLRQEEQKKQQQQDLIKAKEDFISYILSDNIYLSLTNDTLRLAYIEQLWNGEKGEDIKNLIHKAYPKIEKQTNSVFGIRNIGKTEKIEIRQDIKLRTGK